MVFSPITDKKATHMLIKENASHINDKCTIWILSDPWVLSYNNILISSLIKNVILTPKIHFIILTHREALDYRGDESGVEVELEMVAGEHDRGVQRLERASRDSEVVVRGEMCWEERGKLNKISIKILAFLSVSSYI